jgi:hypothetical protein
MIRPSVTIQRVPMPGQHNFNAHLSGALQDRVKVVYFKPEQDAISVGFVIAVANRPMMVFNFKAVQLKDQLAVRNQLLVLGSSVAAAAAQQALIPSAAGFYIGYGNERVRAHCSTIIHS